MEADSRDAVFVELRRRGIRAIKVVAADGSKANGAVRVITRKRVVFAALGLGLAVGVTLALGAPGLRARFERIGRYAPGMEDKVLQLQLAAEEVTKTYERRLQATALGTLIDYEGLATNPASARYEQAIKAGNRELNAARQELRRRFRPLYDIFPPECVNERADAQRCYAEAMDRLDRLEAEFARAEKAYRLLIGHRGAWRVRAGAVEFDEAALAREFEYFRRVPNSAEMRWNRDFGR